MKSPLSIATQCRIVRGQIGQLGEEPWALVHSFECVHGGRWRPSEARTGQVSSLSSSHLREVARRPTAFSLEHRARARFDEEHLLAVGELESATAADGHQTRHRLGESATRSRSGIAAWHWPRRSTTCQARRSSGGPGPAAPVADTAIWSTLSWPLANVVNARALIYE